MLSPLFSEVAYDREAKSKERVPDFDLFKTDYQHWLLNSPAISDVSTAVDIDSEAGGDDEQSDPFLPSDPEEEFAKVFPTFASFLKKQSLKKLEPPEEDAVNCQAWSSIAQRIALRLEEADSESEDELECAHI